MRLNENILNDAHYECKSLVLSAQPAVGIVLGSEWGNSIPGLAELRGLPYHKIGLGNPTVEGHKGELKLLEVKGLNILVWSGRRHWYEFEVDDDLTPLYLPVTLSWLLGARSMIFTNAAGYLDPGQCKTGDLMAITDHINRTGFHPLRGPLKGPYADRQIVKYRFTPLSRLYDRELRASFCQAAQAEGKVPHEGVYVANPGPEYEAPAEVRELAQLGGSAVGMSTAYEAIMAAALGMRVAGISCLTNPGAHEDYDPPDHAEVRKVLNEQSPVIARVLVRLFEQLAAQV